jgi:RNA polymerase-binding transcription factor DksA
MDTKDTEKFKSRLLAEKTELEEELSSISTKDNASPGGRDATSGDLEIDTADDNEVADKFEEIEENTGITDKLEKELAEVKAALDRIAKGKYGICEVSGEPIETKRLEANPSARTCIKHSH